MKKIVLLFLLVVTLLLNSFGQRKATRRVSKYYVVIKEFQNKYVAKHEVVLTKNKKYFKFFSPSSKYKVIATFTKTDDTTTVTIKTSGKKIPEKYFTRYGKLAFTIDSLQYHLTVYQSKDLVNNAEYKDYLFLPFSDKTNSNSTYGTGRYIDLLITDIKDGECIIDFNKAYNPYCAYSNDYNCPIPPKENRLPFAIEAGEMNFAKPVAH